jgi:hypothetical protein
MGLTGGIPGEAPVPIGTPGVAVIEAVADGYGGVPTVVVPGDAAAPGDAGVGMLGMAPVGVGVTPPTVAPGAGIVDMPGV